MLKNNPSYLILGLLSLAASFSCKKKNNNAGQAVQSCELVKISLQTTSTRTITITYDAQGRMVTTETVSPGSPTTDKQYSYSGNMVIVKESVGGTPASIDSITLDSGRIQSDHSVSLSGGSSFLLLYTFAGTEVQRLAEQDSTGTVISSEVFTWSAGNLVSVTTQTGGTTFTNTYSYNSQPSAAGDYWSEYQLITFPLPFIQTANLVTGVANNNGTTTFQYATDGTGKIVRIMESGVNPETDSYQWNCP